MKTDMTGKTKMNLKKTCNNILVFTLFFLSIAGISFAKVPGPEFTCENDVECKFTLELQALAASLDHDPVKKTFLTFTELALSSERLKCS